MVAGDVVVRQRDASWTSARESLVSGRRQQTQVTTAAVVPQTRAVRYNDNDIVDIRLRPRVLSHFE